MNLNYNLEVSSYLDEIQHPKRMMIDALRELVLSTSPLLEENLKWKGPNYFIGLEDRVTIKVLPPGLIQLILHLGVKKNEIEHRPHIQDPHALLNWRGNDRAFINFKDWDDLMDKKEQSRAIIKQWILL